MSGDQDDFVVEYRSKDGLTEIAHRDGIPWHDMPLPPRIHRCKEQTRGYIDFQRVGRCACGASYIMGGWIGKNETRKMERGHETIL